MVNHRCGVCLYCKCSLSLEIIDLSFIQRIKIEVKIVDKTCNLMSLNVSYRSSRPEVCSKKGVLYKFKFIKKDSGKRCFPVNFVKYLRTLFL